MGPRPGEDQAAEQAGDGRTHTHGDLQLWRAADETRATDTGRGEEGAGETLHSLQQLHLPSNNQRHHPHQDHGCELGGGEAGIKGGWGWWDKGRVGLVE